MNKILLTIAAIAAFALSASAQVSLNTTNAIAASTTITSGTGDSFLIPKRATAVDYAITFTTGATNAANASNVVFTISRSIDKVTWSTTGNDTITVPSNGSNTVAVVTNKTVIPGTWYKFNQIQSTATNALSGLAVKVKPVISE